MCNDPKSQETCHREIVNIWSKSEDIAMHFNELLLGFRMKALGFMSLAAGVSSTLLVDKSDGDGNLLLAAALSFLLVVWAAIALIDRFYYQQLLQGAVDSLIDLEKNHDHLHLSTRVEQRFKSRRRPGRTAFYGLPGFALGAAAAGVAYRSNSLAAGLIVVSTVVVVALSCLVVQHCSKLPWGGSAAPAAP